VAAEMTGRAQPNLTRNLAMLQSGGFITMQAHGRRTAPCATNEKIIVEIDPYSDRDRLRLV
jgi:predicted transcriptional regulator